VGGLIAAFALWDGLVIGGPQPTLAFTDLMSAAAPAGAAVACFFAARRSTGQARLGWTLLAAGTASWSLGQAVWDWYNLFLLTPIPFPSLADVGYLLFIPLATGAMLAFPSAPQVAASRTRTALDGLVLACSLLFLSWAVVLGPTYRAASGNWLEKAIGLAYPLGDVIILTVMLIVVNRARPGHRTVLLLVGAGLAGILVSDTLFAYQTVNGLYTNGQFIDNGWFAGFVLIAFAADRSHQAPSSHPTDERLNSIQAITVPLLPLAIAAAVAIAKQLKEGYLEPFLFWNAVALVTFVLARQSFSLLDQRRLARQVEVSYQRLQQVEAERVQLLNNLAHDMAVPLTPIKLQLRILQGKQAEVPEPVRRAHTVIARNAGHLTLLLSDLHDLARMAAGRLRIEGAPMDVAQLARQAVESHEDAYRERGIALRTQLDQDLQATADAGRLNQVLYNFLTNALKFTPPGGTVTVRGVRAGPLVGIEVQDSGRGLTPEEQAKLFKPFSQVHKPGESPEKGTGLGLYIARGIIEGHGGQIGVSSGGLGHGSTFYFRIPVVLPSPSAMMAMAPTSTPN